MSDLETVASRLDLAARARDGSTVALVVYVLALWMVDYTALQPEIAAVAAGAVAASAWSRVEAVLRRATLSAAKASKFGRLVVDVWFGGFRLVLLMALVVGGEKKDRRSAILSEVWRQLLIVLGPEWSRTAVERALGSDTATPEGTQEPGTHAHLGGDTHEALPVPDLQGVHVGKVVPDDHSGLGEPRGGIAEDSSER